MAPSQLSRHLDHAIAPVNRRQATRAAILTLGLLVAQFSAPRAQAQTDYYNTDAGRPITVEDAYPIEQRALELQVAPLRLERINGGAYTWGIEPEIAVGLLPRTQLEVGFPLVYTDLGAGQHSTGLAGVEIAALHNLNVETTIPALAVGAEVLLPVGGLAADRAYPSVKGIATRTSSWARFHVNGQYTFGSRLTETEGGGAHGPAELSQWMGGLAADRTFPLESLLVTAELVAWQPLVETLDVVWETAAGARYQLSPRVAVDGGAGYRFTGNQGWFATFGAAMSVGLPWRP